MNDEEIRVYPVEIESALTEKPPPTSNSDVWCCVIRQWEVDICLHNRAKRAILQHAYEAPRREVGGALVGGVYVHKYPDPGQKDYVYIEIADAVRGDFTRGSSTSLTFTPDTWSQIVSEVEDRFPEKRIVGWYHTHPGHGVFLSEPDRFIQNNFFGHGGQLALVVDHINGRAAFFIGSSQHQGGIQKSSEFTWDDTLYRPQMQRSGTTRPDMSRVQARDYPAIAEDIQAAPARVVSPMDTARPRQRSGLRSRLPSLSWPWSRREKPQPLVESEQEPELRIVPDDIDSLEEQARAHRRAAVYSARYSDMASRPGLLGEFLGCAVLAMIVLLVVILIVFLLISVFSPQHEIPLFFGISVVDPISVVFAGLLALLLLIIVLLVREYLSARS